MPRLPSLGTATRLVHQLLLVWCLGLTVVRADLPVHCVHGQLVGEWELHLDAGGKGSDVACGHKQPDQQDYILDNPFAVEEHQVLKVNLQDPDVAIGPDNEKGFWTVVYDEAIEIWIQGKKFLAFLKYGKSRGGYKSYCGETLPGWFHDDDGSNWGCFVARKTVAVQETDSLPAGDAVVSPTFLEQSLRTKFNRRLVFAPEEHQDFVKRINSIQSHWTAHSYESFRGKSLAELNAMAGRKKRNVVRGGNSNGDNSDKGDVAKLPRPSMLSDELPKSWDWRNVNGVNYVPSVRQQGSCGSCFTMSTLTAFESRVRILTKNTDQTVLSPQNVLSCSRYNQACDGGYPYLVGKHAQDFGLVPESSLPYESSSDVSCSNTKRPSQVYYASSYGYIGGYYGACTEEAMIRELIANGPIIASFEPPFDFMMYRSGVYVPPPTNAVLSELAAASGITPAHKWHIGWEKVDHSVAVVGYGETPEGLKYWIIQNTWGEDWGENGYFRMKRGTDEAAIESIAEVVHPDVQPVDSNLPGWRPAPNL